MAHKKGQGSSRNGRDSSGQRLKLVFRIGTSTSTGVQIPGVNVLRQALPAGTYIGLTLILAFGLTFLFRRWRDRRVYREPDESLETIES